MGVRSSSIAASSLRPPAIATAASLAVSFLSANTPAHCESNEDVMSRIKNKINAQSVSDLLKDNETLDAVLTSVGSSVSSVISSGLPSSLSYGFCAGFLSGFALKKIGKLASVCFGLSFLSLQSLAHAGYIDVHHDKLQKQVEDLLDRNRDGKVDSEDLKSILGEVQKMASYGVDEDNAGNMVASGGGFGMGFFGGLRSG